MIFPGWRGWRLIFPMAWMSVKPWINEINRLTRPFGLHFCLSGLRLSCVNVSKTPRLFQALQLFCTARRLALFAFRLQALDLVHH